MIIGKDRRTGIGKLDKAAQRTDDYFSLLDDAGAQVLVEILNLKATGERTESSLLGHEAGRRGQRKLNKPVRIGEALEE